MPSSGYSAITFVANEQPTTAKWNLIGSNDSAFNLGTGLEDSTILARHIAANVIQAAKIDWTTAGQIWWQELGRATAATSGITSLSITPITARKYLHIIWAAPVTTVLTEILRFNGDSGNNYAWAKGSGGGAYAASTVNQSGIQGGGSASHRFFNYWINNVASREKSITAKFTYNVTAGAGTSTVDEDLIGKWANSAAQITRVDMTATGGSFDAGSELIVLGHD